MTLFCSLRSLFLWLLGAFWLLGACSSSLEESGAADRSSSSEGERLFQQKGTDDFDIGAERKLQVEVQGESSYAAQAGHVVIQDALEQRLLSEANGQPLQWAIAPTSRFSFRFQITASQAEHPLVLQWSAGTASALIANSNHSPQSRALLLLQKSATSSDTLSAPTVLSPLSFWLAQQVLKSPQKPLKAMQIQAAAQLSLTPSDLNTLPQSSIPATQVAFTLQLLSQLLDELSPASLAQAQLFEQWSQTPQPLFKFSQTGQTLELQSPLFELLAQWQSLPPEQGPALSLFVQVVEDLLETLAAEASLTRVNLRFTPIQRTLTEEGLETRAALALASGQQNLQQIAQSLAPYLQSETQLSPTSFGIYAESLAIPARQKLGQLLETPPESFGSVSAASISSQITPYQLTAIEAQTQLQRAEAVLPLLTSETLSLEEIRLLLEQILILPPENPLSQQIIQELLTPLSLQAAQKRFAESPLAQTLSFNEYFRTVNQIVWKVLLDFQSQLAQDPALAQKMQSQLLNPQSDLIATVRALTQLAISTFDTGMGYLATSQPSLLKEIVKSPLLLSQAIPLQEILQAVQPRLEAGAAWPSASQIGQWHSALQTRFRAVTGRVQITFKSAEAFVTFVQNLALEVVKSKN